MLFNSQSLFLTFRLQKKFVNELPEFLKKCDFKSVLVYGYIYCRLFGLEKIIYYFSKLGYRGSYAAQKFLAA
jgi:hypothetical protein